MPRNLAVERALAAERAAPSDPSSSALASRRGAIKEPAVFAIRNLSVLAYAQGFTLWHVRLPGVLDDALGAGYFDAAVDMFAAGDMIHVSASDGGATLYVASAVREVAVAVMARTPAAAAMKAAA